MKISIHKRLIHLDALRGVAILLVIYHHAGLRFPEAPRSLIGNFFVGVGWAGVDIFFAISGYLITGILLRGGSSHLFLFSFYIKRFFRIVPLYTFALVLFFLMSFLTGQERELLSLLWINVSFLTAWFIPFLGENKVPYEITWSVSVEEFAYVLFGALALLGETRFRLSFYWVVIGAIAIRLIFFTLHLFDPVTLYYFAPARIDAVAFGGLAACYQSRPVSKVIYRPIVGFLAIILILSLFFSRGRQDPFLAVVGYSALSMASAYLVMVVAQLDSDRASLMTKVLADVGAVSYFIYLFHVFVIAAVQKVLPVSMVPLVNLFWIAGISTILTYIPALVSWKYFEYPVLRYGRRLAERRAAGLKCES